MSDGSFLTVAEMPTPKQYRDLHRSAMEHAKKGQPQFPQI
jgi:hypothetical protein